jgi:hypothetical protein
MDAVARRKTPPPPPPTKRSWGKAWVALAAVVGLAVAGFRVARPEEFGYQAEQVRTGNGARGEPCEVLPSAEEVQAAVAAATDVLSAVAAADPSGRSWVHVDLARCPGRADLRIYHANAAQYRTIQRILADSSLRDVPVRWTNI